MQAEHLQPSDDLGACHAHQHVLHCWTHHTDKGRLEALKPDVLASVAGLLRQAHAVHR